MKDLTQDILTSLKATTFTYTVDPTNIRESGMMRLDGFPSIVVTEVDNSAESLIGAREMLTSLAYQVDIYAKNLVVANVPVGKAAVARSIAAEVDEALRTDLLFRRVSGNLIPFDDDTARYVLRFDCVVTEADYINRR